MDEIESLKFYLLAELQADSLEYTHTGLSRNFRCYYKASPAFADVIEGNSALRFIARMHLAPFVRAANLALNIN